LQHLLSNEDKNELNNSFDAISWKLSLGAHTRTVLLAGLLLCQTAISFIITPLSRQTAWFRGLMVVMFIGLLTAANGYRVSELQQIRQMRLKIARDLLDLLTPSCPRNPAIA